MVPAYGPPYLVAPKCPRALLLEATIGGHMTGKPRRAPHFLPQNLHTRSPTAPIWNIFNGQPY